VKEPVMETTRDAHVVLWKNMYDPSGAEQLRSAGCRVTVVDSVNVDDLLPRLADARALWVQYPQKVTAQVLDAAPMLQIVSTSGFGSDNIDIEGATRRGILVVNQRGFGRIPVSEHTIMLMLALARRLLWAEDGARDGSAWAERTALSTFELAGKTVGVVGLGFIGSELARKLRVGFGCNVIGYDPYVDPRISPLLHIERVETLDEMLPRVRFLCLCLELTAESKNIIGAKELAKLSEDAFVVNTSRGGVLDLEALTQALEAGKIAGAGLDVYNPEPLPQQHRLLKLKNVVLTPHTAGVTVETNVRSTRSAVTQLLAGLAGEMPAFPKNAEAWEGAQSRRRRLIHA
jgi:phosphoglycerate dehydrogenase-like enzyme